MSENSTPKRSTAVSDSEHARIVAEVLEDQARRRAVREASGPGPEQGETSFFVQVGLLVMGTFFFYLLFFSPTWIAPTAADPISTVQVENGLRFHIFLAANQVEAFQDQQGRYPSSLDELGISGEDLQYRRLDSDTFEIVGRTGETRLRYVSSLPLDEFYGDAGKEIMGGTS